MPNLCKLQIIGHLGRDAEVKYTPGGDPLAEFQIAVNRKTKEKEDPLWFKVALWGKRGLALAPILKKGMAVFVSGDFWSRQFEGRNGWQVALELRADTVEILTPRDSQSDRPAPQSQPVQGGPGDDEEIPF